MVGRNPHAPTTAPIRAFASVSRSLAAFSAFAFPRLNWKTLTGFKSCRTNSRPLPDGQPDPRPMLDNALEDAACFVQAGAGEYQVKHIAARRATTARPCRNCAGRHGWDRRFLRRTNHSFPAWATVAALYERSPGLTSWQHDRAPPLPAASLRPWTIDEATDTFLLAWNSLGPSATKQLITVPQTVGLDLYLGTCFPGTKAKER